jgi:hypothetical protein
MSQLVDLDAVVSPDIRVKFDDTTYRLPGDAPSETLLRIQLISEQLSQAVTDTDVDKLLQLREELSEQIEALFSIRQDVDPGSIQLSEKQIEELLSQLFKHYFGVDVGGEEDGEGGDRPTSTPQRPRSGRRSAKSSARKASRSSTLSPT